MAEMGGFSRLISKILHLKSVQFSRITELEFTRKAAKKLLALWPVTQFTFFCEFLDSYQILLSRTISDAIVSDTHYRDSPCGTLITLLCPWVQLAAHFLMFPTSSTQGQLRHFICISSLWETLLTHMEIKCPVSCCVCLPWCVWEWSWPVIKLIGGCIYYFFLWRLFLLDWSREFLRSGGQQWKSIYPFISLSTRHVDIFAPY